MKRLIEIQKQNQSKLIATGITNEVELKKAIELGATYVGFIFILSSPYGIDIEKAKNIMKNQSVQAMGIFQNSDLADIIYIANELFLNAVVLNGRESQSFISELRLMLPEYVKIIKIAHLCDSEPKMDYKDVDFYLLGGFVGEELEPNWELLKRIDLSNVFISSNWKKEAVCPEINAAPLGYEYNFKMLTV